LHNVEIIFVFPVFLRPSLLKGNPVRVLMEMLDVFGPRAAGKLAPDLAGMGGFDQFFPIVNSNMD
jgi:hypothetical protein